jgi:type I restriction-modification system DNA methylase subunit
LVTEKHIKELEIFYTHDDKEYKKGQPNLFYPYKFNKIPIQLISNVYEEFLGRTNKKEKKSKGIFYTRTFVIDFMLSHTIYPKIEKQPNSTVLDPACGSGAFLVQAFNRILISQPKKNLSIDEKAEILQKQIFGVDTDVNALQITAFSLYLSLLHGISKKEIQEQLKKQNSILPSLIGYNLLQKNTIVDDVKFLLIRRGIL